eukprot:CAMPEP_0172471962 /NCGR_PEP_ID=MMETSP1065-20121228/68088_1 /TAXON_ID=265537 /ORGANISM="Amphiprora paludosa, Strain CCMP125" /LENGTH=1428 /DNA_ID=CAMNT_0013230077 /DNA_START=31 /DNA_END=4318 /DNA_ORIENTATION=-
MEGNEDNQPFLADEHLEPLNDIPYLADEHLEPLNDSPESSPKRLFATTTTSTTTTSNTTTKGGHEVDPPPPASGLSDRISTIDFSLDGDQLDEARVTSQSSTDIPPPPIPQGHERSSSSTSTGPDARPSGLSSPSVSPAKANKKKKDAPRIPAAENGNSSEHSGDRIRLGICAMDKKAKSKPMAEILSRLDENLFHVIFFGDETILKRSVEEWPICHVVIAFFSKGYPLDKAKDYVRLRNPVILNDLEMQETLQDRRRVYDLLEESGIDVPRHVYLSRDGYVSTGTGDGNGEMDQDVREFDDHIEVNGVTINKPFVEKPVNAEDHNIAIYYPTSAGGGCKKLFRKVGNRSSEFYPDINEVRQDGSYIYEEFVETQGTDVKMYTVGPDYGHAEARKSPTVDGKVERNSDGKEVRFPVILTFREKEIARRIVIVFKQFVCGFDILRVQEGHAVVSYVCDVNGFSFVKNSRKYYDDCAQILSEHLLAKMKPDALTTFSTLDPLVTTSLNHLDDEIAESDAGSVRSGVRRHTTNTTNIYSRAARMLQGEPTSISDGEDGDLDAQSHSSLVDNQQSPPRGSTGETGELLTQAAATLMEGAVPVREFPDNLTSEPASLVASTTASVNGKGSISEEEEFEPPKRRRSLTVLNQESHQEELRCVLAIVRHGDRTPKQKLKVNMTEPHILQYYHDHCEDCTTELKVKAKAPLTEFLATVKTTLEELPNQRSATTEEQQDNRNIRMQLMHMRDILERWKIHGLNRKLQIKPRCWEEEDPETGEMKRRCTEVQLILKWGGNLTKLGEKQAIALGHRHRHEMYPDAPGGGILRLHSTFRHDLKIKTSDEGRVMKTAAAFAKGLLELEGDLPPILVSLVHKEKGSMHMLDPTGNKEVKNELDICKDKITANLQKDIDIATAGEEELNQLVGPKELTGLRSAIHEVGNPRRTLMQIHETMGHLLSQLEEMLDDMGSGDEKRIEGGEGVRGRNEDDVALSGVKLYKGETLLELTERWRFIYDRLYDPESDKFDLSRIPDVHDNVRFDVLHNPQMGLTESLQKLYNLAKEMADTVVPQEYGTTSEEKRDLGVKICHGLLEKIKYDLNVARMDNKVDMRYMINMKYEADLPINTMGRRIRTRLYFTSESHLHTVLNVFRFGQCSSKGLLSEHGAAIINATRELCYLTQIVMRVFEDSRRTIDDPRRFRVEILFSPGATATPYHMNEAEREHDASRYGTEPLQVIGREGLTCAEVEAFFEQAIMAGKSDDDTYDAASTSTAAEGAKRKAKKNKKDKKDKKDKKEKSGKKVEVSDVASAEGPIVAATTVPVTPPREVVTKTPPEEVKIAPAAIEGTKTPLSLAGTVERQLMQVDELDIEDESEADIDDLAALADRPLLWSAIVISGLALGAVLLVSGLLGIDGNAHPRDFVLKSILSTKSHAVHFAQ